MDNDAWNLHHDSPERWLLFDNWRPFILFLAECAKTDRTEAELAEIGLDLERSRPIDGRWVRCEVADNYLIEASLGRGDDGRLYFRLERCYGPETLRGMIDAAAWVMSRYILQSQPGVAASDG